MAYIVSRTTGGTLETIDKVVPTLSEAHLLVLLNIAKDREQFKPQDMKIKVELHNTYETYDVTPESKNYEDCIYYVIQKAYGEEEEEEREE